MRIFLTDKSTCSQFVADAADQSDFLRLARGLWKKQEFHNESLHGQLYVHIGYCQARCSFCAYPSRILRRNEDLDNLLEMLRHEMTWQRHHFQDRGFDALYVGGGTPSLLSPSQIERLFSDLSQSFAITSGPMCEWSFEAAPSSLDTAKIEALRHVGVNRLSLGVQSLDPEVLNRNGRVNPSVKECLKLLDEILSAGFLEVNVDLMAGIPGRNSTNLGTDFAILSDAGCNLITVYIDKRTYRDPHKEEERCSLLKEVGRLAGRFPDYIVNGGQGLNEYNTFIRDNGYNLSFKRRFTTDLYRPDVYCLGLGEFAQSCTDKYIFQYQQEPSPYL